MSVVLPNTPVGLLALALEALDDVALSVFRGPLCGIEHRVLWYGGRSWRHAPSGDPGLEREWSGAVAASRVLPPIDASSDLKKFLALTSGLRWMVVTVFAAKDEIAASLSLSAASERGIQALKGLDDSRVQTGDYASEMQTHSRCRLTAAQPGGISSEYHVLH
ncbi:hypothetical protein BASA61_006537 [Batrachochytrium salamandrivorans]|nr:hypothetical protein BASA61_006537 [Batrachochytrium salamandrivorans]